MSGWVRTGLAILAVTTTVTAQAGQLRAGAGLAFVVTDTLVGIAFIALGVVALRLAPRSRIAPVALLGAVAWQLGTLAMVTADHPATFGFFAFSGYHDLVITFLILGYPTGPIRQRAGRMLLLAIAAAHVFGSATRLLAFDPAAWGAPAPDNPAAVIRDLAVFEASQDWTGRVLGLLILAVAAIVSSRWITNSVPARRAAGLLPVAAVVWALLYLQDTWLRPVGGLLLDDPTAFYVLATARGAVPLSIAMGLLSMRLRQSRVADLLADLGDAPRRGDLEPALRSVLGDPALEVWWRDGQHGGYVRAAEPDMAREGFDEDERRVVTPVVVGRDEQLVCIRHDASLLDNAQLVQAVGSAVRMVAEKEQMEAQIRAQLTEVRASRARILHAGAAERARLERNLHDGSQQRLVSLALQLRMTRARIDPAELPEIADAVDRAAKELQEALAELRELARGIHPAALTDGGLPAALPLLAERCPVPASIAVQLDRRLAALTEETVYYVVAEALTNVAKHAAAEAVTVRVRERGGWVELEVIDDGVGGADPDDGSGLQGLRDRVEAVGGTLTISSSLHAGTSITGRVPCDPAEPQP